MKKLLLTLSVGLFGLVASHAADTYTVYNNGVLTEGIEFYGWNNVTMNPTAEDPTDKAIKVISFRPTENKPDASCGWLSRSSNVIGPLNTATLNFKWYATTVGTQYMIRLTGGGIEENYSFTITEGNVNTWNTEALSVPEKFPGVASKWKEIVQGGEGYIFSVVQVNGTGTGESTIYVNDINYSNLDASWKGETIDIQNPTTVPTPTQSASDVFSFFSSYGDNVSFNNGGWGASTSYTTETIDGKQVLKLNSFNYLGLVDFNINISDYDYMHVDYWTSYPNVPFGFVPISLKPSTVDTPIWDAETVNLNEWNSYDAPLSYFNADKSQIEQIKFVANQTGGSAPLAYIANVYFWKEPAAKETEIKLTVEKEAITVTTSTATIPYVIEFTDDSWNPSEVTVTVNYTSDTDNGSVTYNNNADNKIELTNLKPNTPYTYSIVAVATYNDQTYTSNTENVSFTTARAEDDEDPVFEGTSVIPDDGNLTNCWIKGTESTDRVNISSMLYYGITYNTDGTLEVRILPSNPQFNNIEGMVPQLNINGDYTDFTKNSTGDGWTCTPDATYTSGQELTIYFYCAYNGGSAAYQSFTYTVGSVQTGVEGVAAEDGEAQFFTIQGVKVTNPDKGLFIKVQNGKATKVIL